MGAPRRPGYKHGDPLGRPRKEIDLTYLDALAATGAPLTEIASELDVSVDTLRRRFLPRITRAADVTKNRLRAAQVRVALAGNVPMLTHLGKTWLRQKETSQVELTGLNGGAIVIEGSLILGADGRPVEDDPE